MTDTVVSFRCYGPARREAGAELLVVQGDAISTVADALRALTDDPATPAGLTELLPHCAVAIDDELVALDRPVTAGDELALLPPVAGG